MTRERLLRLGGNLCAALVGALGVLTIAFAFAGKTHTITEKGKKFSPSGTLDVAVGDVVKFQNDDGVDHNVIIKKMSYDSGLQKPGASNEVAMNAAGKFKARCAIHPKMKLTINAK